MTILMSLLEKNDKYAIYLYGFDIDKLDGKIKFSFDDLNNPTKCPFEILQKPSDDRPTGYYVETTAIKLIKKLRKGEIPEHIGFQS